MKAKLFALSIFALFLLSVASALTLTPSSVDTLTRSDNSTSFTVSSDSLMNIATVFPYTLIIKDSNNRPVTLTITSASGLSGVSTATFNVILNSVDSDFDFGKYSSNLKIDAVSSTNSLVTASANIPIYFEQDFCRYGNVGGDLRLSIDFTDVKGYGSDTDWYLFDEVSGDIEVKNRGDDNIDNIIVRWGLYDKDTGEFIIDEEENDFDLDNGDSETINIKFTLDPEDFPADFNEKDFEFFVKVYSDDLGENVQCNSLKETGVKIVRDSDFVILKDIKLSTAPQCGESITVRATAWNIGENSEDDVYAIISSPKLGINSQEIKIGDLDSLEDKKISFSFDIPSNMPIGEYGLEFRVYNEDDDIFENDDNDQAIFTSFFSLNESCKPERASQITASLESSEAVAGKQIIISATVKNTGSAKTNYQILLNNYESWAELESLSLESLSLNPGESGQVTITLVPDKTVSGNKEFTIQAVADGNVEEQPISVSISPYKGFFSGFTGFSIGNLSGGNWFIWAIVIVNVILILLIVIVAVKIARKRAE